MVTLVKLEATTAKIRDGFLTPKSFRFDWNRFSSSKSFKSSASDFGKDENPFQIEDETTIQVRTWPAWFGHSKDPIET